VDFNDRLEQAILLKYKNIKQFSEAVGMNDALVRTYVKGKSVPSIKKVEEFANILDVTSAWLAYGVDVSPEFEDEIVDLVNLIHEKVDDWLELKEKEMSSHRKSILVKIIYTQLQEKENLSEEKVNDHINSVIDILDVA